MKKLVSKYRKNTIYVGHKLCALFTIVICFISCEKTGLQSSSEIATYKLGRVAATSGTSGTSAASDFTIIVMPDTQNYMSGYFGGTYAMFTSQIDWIKNNKTTKNIVYVAGVGDVVEHGDDPAYASVEWPKAATNGYYRLETSNIPYGLAVGNHDQTPVNTSILTATTTKFNQFFGRSHFATKSYYGGNLEGASSNNNNSHYDLFSAGGLDFIVIYLEYDNNNEQSVLLNDWAYGLCTTYASRKAIIATHYAIRDGDPGPWGTQGYRIWNRLKDRTNVFMILGGHVYADGGEGYREDTYNGHTIRTYLSNYQGRTKGGNGALRVLNFSVENDDVTVKTYSPFANTYEIDVNSQFTKPLFGAAPTALVPNGKYKIVARNSSKTLVIYNAATTNGADVVQWDYTVANPKNDEWNFIQTGTSGYYKIVNVNSGLAMNVYDVSTEVGGLVKQYPYGDDDIYNDEFAIIPVGSGYYKIIARHSGICLNVSGDGSNNGALIKQWDYVGDTNTQFQLVAIP